MHQTDWAPEHSEALREHLACGMSFSQIAGAINAKFKTAYSRNATIGRARRLGLSSPKRPQRASGRSSQPSPRSKPPRLHRLRERRAPEPASPKSIAERPRTAKLRCVAIAPRHLGLLDLAAGDCRYPYGGDEEGEAISFCGHPQREGSSYCTAHFHLTCGPGTRAERSAATVLLRLVEAA